MGDGYWRSAAEDAAMQDEHGFIWLAMLETVAEDLGEKKVLDAGCNQGGFLRLLVDAQGIAEGWGYDPAPGAIEDARRLAGARPLTFEVAETVPPGWTGFGVAFSREVLYLVRDLAGHARSVFDALDPGASYYAVMGVHDRSAIMAEWHAANAASLDLPPINDLDDVAELFESTGFSVALAELRFRFVPASAHRAQVPLLDWFDYYRRDKVLLRFSRPAAGGSPGVRSTP
jgi:SAM-dependent methyltransferase